MLSASVAPTVFEASDALGVGGLEKIRDKRADFFGLLGGSKTREVEARLFQAACDVEDMVGGACRLFSSSFKLSTLATMLSLAREVREMPGVAEDGRSSEPGL